MSKVFGIDLGTTYSCIGYVDEHDKAVVIPNSDNDTTTPSVVYFESPTNIVVGNAAKEVTEIYPNQVVSTVKRVMGDSTWKFEYEDKEYSPQEVSSFILEKLVNDAKEYLNEEVKDVIITVPAYFGINEKEATKQAGEIAGLNVRGIIPEPTAAAIAYGIENDKDEVVMVYDLGGGTFDITVIKVDKSGITVISTDGDHQLGGRNWDETLAGYFAQVFEDETGVDKDTLLEDMETWQELLNRAEDAKKSLTSKEKTILRVSHDGEKATIKLTREKFDELTNHLLERTINLTNDVLNNIKEKGVQTVDKILLVGGSTYMPQVKDRLIQEYQYEIVVFDPNLSVAKGASIYGKKLSIEDEIKIIIAENTGENVENIDLTKVKKEDIKKATKEVIKESGYSIGGVVNLIEKNIINVTAKSFGIEVLDINENMTPKISNLIRVDDEIPIEITNSFPTAYDRQTGINLICYENRERVGSDGRLLTLDTSNEVGRAELDFGQPLPIDSLVDITFKLSEDGLLEVYAKDQTTGRDLAVSFQTESIISQKEIKELQEERKAIKVS